MIGLFVFLRNPKGIANRTWGLFTLSIVVWTFGQFMESTIMVESNALQWNYFLLPGVIFIPISFMNFMFALQDCLYENRHLIRIVYFTGGIFIILLFTNNLIKGVVYRAPFGFYSNPKILYYLFLLFFLLVVVYTYTITFIKYKSFNEHKKLQLNYLIAATIIGFICGTFNFLPAFNVPTT
ncbi:MAG: hypothetical protein JNN05_08160, partial [Candidatus Omnitrophica bacterium]|nr:hypothetical protein [Candidatus Omnitrophota bacterium]